MPGRFLRHARDARVRLQRRRISHRSERRRGRWNIDTAHPERAVCELQRAGDDDRICAGQRGRCRSHRVHRRRVPGRANKRAATFTAIDAVCTHEGCTVNGANGATYVCPCHGSRYDRSGQVVAGPAKAVTPSVHHVVHERHRDDRALSRAWLPVNPEIDHLLRRAGFGVSALDVDIYRDMSPTRGGRRISSTTKAGPTTSMSASDVPTTRWSRPRISSRPTSTSRTRASAGCSA